MCSFGCSFSSTALENGTFPFVYLPTLTELRQRYVLPYGISSAYRKVCFPALYLLPRSVFLARDPRKVSSGECHSFFLPGNGSPILDLLSLFRASDSAMAGSAFSCGPMSFFFLASREDPPGFQKRYNLRWPSPFPLKTTAVISDVVGVFLRDRLILNGVRSRAFFLQNKVTFRTRYSLG